MTQEGVPLDFWSRDIADVLNKDVALREKLAKYFVKNTGSEGKKYSAIDLRKKLLLGSC